jgi:hypothetical protein
VSVDGAAQPTVQVGEDDLYTLVDQPGEAARDRLLRLRLSPGTSAYAFTFG